MSESITIPKQDCIKILKRNWHLLSEETKALLNSIGIKRENTQQSLAKFGG